MVGWGIEVADQKHSIADWMYRFRVQKSIFRAMGEPPSVATNSTMYCFSHAGGSASLMYARWSEPGLHVRGVDLPGRGLQRSASLEVSSDQVLQHVLRTIEDDIAAAGSTDSLYLVGHSVGAMIALYIAAHLHRQGLPVRGLVVSGHNGPRALNNRTQLHRLNERELRAALRGLGGLPPETESNEALLDLFVPVIRADLELAETTTWQGGCRLPIPLTVIGGARDRLVSPSGLAAWQAESTLPLDLQIVDGDHFSYVNDGRLREITLGRATCRSVAGNCSA